MDEGCSWGGGGLSHIKGGVVRHTSDGLKRWFYHLLRCNQSQNVHSAGASEVPFRLGIGPKKSGRR